MKKIRLLIADDHTIVRMGLKSLVAMEDDLELVGEAKNGTESVDEAERLQPDVVIMDLMMPKMDGVAATAEIKRRMPSVQVVVLTSFAGADAIAHALEVGAIGAVLKSAAETELVAAVRNAAAGRECVSPEIQRHLVADPPVTPLTDRQRDILLSVTRGLSNSDIARELGIAEITVKNHVAALFEKLGAANRAEAVAIALRKHLTKM